MASVSICARDMRTGFFAATSRTKGANAGLVDGNADFAVVATFDDVDGWRAYDTDPDHVRMKVELIKPRLAQRTALQFEH